MKNEILKDNKEIETFEKVGKVMAEIEVSKQKATLAQIEATREDNQRQYDFAIENKKWHKSMNIACTAVFILLIASLYLILFTEKIEIGLGLLSTTLASVFGYLAGVGSSKT
ncbi:TPA: hypothetical protein SG861_001580 [Campylobacter coli]|nr:hypothetical protein [Campylobacter coli]